MDNFDWVAARSECCMFDVSVKLKVEIEADIRARNEQLKAEQKPRILRLVPTGADSFAVRVHFCPKPLFLLAGPVSCAAFWQNTDPLPGRCLQM
jgi:hypothetical protein